ncbi:anthranilate synthase component II [Chungangia koreensis]|uniref:Anthranilate synthase component II n=1 Tax=Chungangia koreensis TaxID=752657 RepID=A0ABV8X0K0_9LACT
MILVIDNYDSFTFNLVQYLKELGEELTIARNDEITIEEIRKLKADSILLSPGPGNPDSAGVCLDVVRQLYKEIPILGVCLGQQVIGQAFGGVVRKAVQPMHGKVSTISHDGLGVFSNLPSPLNVARYHSLVIDELPACLTITARTGKGEIMGIRHTKYKLEAVQFHPEAILTEYGMEMLRNFFEGVRT